jgi:hypothetical protein
MGYKLKKFSIIPCENEQIDAAIKVCKENRSVLYGVVLDECNEPVEDAVVKLLEKNEEGSLESIYHTFTDEDGEFLFGPLNPGSEYVVKVWIKHEKSRMIIHENDCQHIYDDCDDTHHEHEDDCDDANHHSKYSYTYNNEHHNSCADECYDSWNKKDSCDLSYPKITHKITKQYGKRSKNYRSKKILHNECNEFESIKDED